jgi:hypothetical protein
MKSSFLKLFSMRPPSKVVPLHQTLPVVAPNRHGQPSTLKIIYANMAKLPNPIVNTRLDVASELSANVLGDILASGITIVSQTTVLYQTKKV